MLLADLLTCFAAQHVGPCAQHLLACVDCAFRLHACESTSCCNGQCIPVCCSARLWSWHAGGHMIMPRGQPRWKGAPPAAFRNAKVRICALCVCNGRI